MFLSDSFGLKSDSVVFALAAALPDPDYNGAHPLLAVRLRLDAAG